jgi:dimethylamine/trimethylamine dehydrogenase
VTLAEARSELGGRVSREARLPTLAEWGRVRDWRIAQLNKLPTVEIFLDSRLDAAQIREFGADRVVLATGATWRRSGVGRSSWVPVPGHEAAHVLSAEDILDGARPGGRVLVYDDDNYYMGAVVAIALAAGGAEVTVVTPVGRVAEWSYNTDEEILTQKRLKREGIRCETLTMLSAVRKKRRSRTHHIASVGRRRVVEEMRVAARSQIKRISFVLQRSDRSWQASRKPRPCSTR